MYRPHYDPLDFVEAVQQIRAASLSDEKLIEARAEGCGRVESECVSLLEILGGGAARN
jgi:hypothetical protein